jgi:integrase
MAQLSYYLDTRRARSDGSYPIKLAVTLRTRTLISIDMYARLDEWQDGEFLRKAANARARNMQLREILNKVERYLYDNSDEAAFLSNATLKRNIQQLLSLAPRKSPTLLSFMLRAREGLQPRTQALYKWAADKVRAYDADVVVAGVTDSWVRGFVSHHQNAKLANNTVRLAFAYISRAVQLAIDEGVISRRPYTSLKLRQEPTRKRSLTVEQMRELRDMKLTGRQEWARDAFLLSFYMLGMNTADMCDASIGKGVRLEYKRRKTGQLYSVLVPDEARQIIKKWKTGKRMLDRCGLRTSGAVGTMLTRYLRQLLPGLTMYYARHTWATIAAELEIPIETISHALGHQIGSPTTAIYVAYNQKKVDAANRKVIDYLNADLKAGEAKN